jgi:hypothetical protein
MEKISFTYEYLDSLFGELSEAGIAVLPVSRARGLKIRNLSVRHDVDISLKSSIQLARWESNRNIYATYCLQLTSPFYNVLLKKNRDYIEELVELGHEIGLHYDPTILTSPSSKTHNQEVTAQIEVLQDIIGNPITTMSIHNPILNFPVIEIPELICTYDKKFLNSKMYISDSSMKFRVPDPISRILETDLSVHLLLHPEYWNASSQTLRDIFKREEKAKISEMREEYENYQGVINFSLANRETLDLQFRKSLGE